MPDPGTEQLDLILWGATGYTGRLVARVLADNAPPGLRWALGARDRTRLESLRAELGVADVPLVTADARDAVALGQLVRQTRVVVSTVGPFARFGTPLVEACVEHGVDYCDITGEVHWIRGNVDRLHERAIANGARIVHCCGFDSIPSDLGVWSLHDHLTRRHGRRLASAQLSVVAARGGFSGGTVASLLGVLEQAATDRELRRVLADPYALNPPGERRGPDGRDQQGARYDAELDRWTAPFVMAAINTRIVRRTNALLGYPYGRDFRYGENVLAADALRARLFAGGLGAVLLGGSFGPTRWLLRRFLPAPGTGPSPAERARGRFAILVRGTSDGERPIAVEATVSAELDPGYGATSRMVVGAALSLALDELPTRGGILTPAACLGRKLLDRLGPLGIDFRVREASE